MDTLIVYYSRTGTTRRLALALADALHANVAEIECDRYGSGPFNYLRAGYDSVRGNLPSIEIPETRYADYDLVVLGAPVWTSYPALPLRAFLAGNPQLPSRVGLFFTYGGHSAAAQAQAQVEALLPQPVTAVLAVKSGEVGDDELAPRIADFTDQLTQR